MSDRLSEIETEAIRLTQWSETVTDEQRNRMEESRALLRDGGAIIDALTMTRGDGQQRIAHEGLVWIDLLLRKNADYGCAVWNSPVLKPSLPPGDAMLVRMSDKIDRMRTLLNGAAAQVDESLRDSIRDLGAYCLLYLAMPAGTDDGRAGGDDGR